MTDEELTGHLYDVLRSEPATRDYPESELDALASALGPILRSVVRTELFMIASELETDFGDNTDEASQGVLFVAAELHKRARG